MNVVVDASVITDIVLPGPDASRIRDRLVSHSLYAPQLMAVECQSVIRRHLIAGALSESSAEDGLALLRDLPVLWIDIPPLLEVAWRYRSYVSAYDAVYIAAAVGLGAPLYTRDRRLVRAVPNIAVLVP